MDKSTRDDFLEDLMEEGVRLNNEIRKLQNQIRQLEAERDQWQKQAMNHG